MSEPIAEKVLLIGWDAADWNVIHPLMDRGEMPHLESLVNQGVMVSNHHQRAHAPIHKPWPMMPGTVHPKRLINNLEALRWHPQRLEEGHMLPFVPEAARVDQEKDHRLETIARIICDCSTIHAATLALMHHEPWDFTAVYLDAIDHFSHGFMRYHPPRLDWVSKQDFDIYNRVVESGYIYHDMMRGDCWKRPASIQRSF